MSIQLSFSDGKPRVKTWDSTTVRVGDQEITMSDFCDAVMYVLENTDLSGSGDPRIVLVEQVKGLVPASGFGDSGSLRFQRVEHPVSR